MAIDARGIYEGLGSASLRVLGELHGRGSLSRTELGAVSGLSTTSVHRAVTELSELGLIVEDRTTPIKQGRPGLVVSLNPSAMLAVGVDVGSYNTRIGIVDWCGKVLHMERYPTRDLTPEATLGLMQRILAKCGDHPVAGVGVGISGLVDHVSGVSVFCPNLKGWDGFPVARELCKLTGLDARVDTSARCMTLSEHTYGAGRGVDDMICVSVGQGISAGIMVGGAVFRGSNGFSGEVGHVTAVQGGYRCTCGNDGCLENYVTESQVYLMLQAKLKGTKAHSELRTLVGEDGKVTAEAFRQALDMGDRLATEHLMETGNLLGTTLANLANVFDPRLMVLCGGVIEGYPTLVDEVRRSIRVKALNPIQGRLEVRAGAMGYDGAVNGAACMVLQPFLKPAG